MRTLDIGELQVVQGAIDSVVGYLTDNSCSDPDCCGGPWYSRESYEEGLKMLASVGIEVDA